MNIKKISIISLCILCLIIVLTACGKTESNSQNTTNTTNTANKPKFNIGVCQGEVNEINSQILLGFEAAINDKFTDKNVTISTQIADENNSCDMIVDNYVQSKKSLLFTIGENAMLSAHAKTTDIPIVASSVMDYQRVLNIASDKEWDKTTKMNITGVSSAPNMSDILSMMIEATPDITSVGIIYYPGDLDSVYQNRTLETYLSQAGIAWKEYEVYSPSISDDALSEIVSFACGESSAIYIPARSSLVDRMDTISRVTLASNIPTVGGDEVIGRETLCSMYNDPFDQGYQAGTMAYSILNNKQKPQSMSIDSVSESAQQKLYAGYYADALGRTFPKSFKEHDYFLATYIPGSKTTRDIPTK